MQRTIFTAVTLLVSGAALAGGGHDMGNMQHGSGGKMMSSGSHWISPEAAQKRVNPVERNEESITRGADLFAANCASCHGRTGVGDGPAAVALNPKPANLRKMSGQHPDGDFAWKIANGRGAMPAWKRSLDENQIWDLTNFIQSMSMDEYAGKAGGKKALSGGGHEHGEKHDDS